MKRIFLIALIAFPSYLLAQPNATIKAFKAEKLFVQGKELYENNSFQAAINIFNQVVDLDQDHQTVYELLGESYFKLGDYERAIENYQLAARQHPQNAELRNSMGVSAAYLRQYRAAAAYFYEALQIDPDHKGAKTNLDIANRKLREAGELAYNGEDYPRSQEDPNWPYSLGPDDGAINNGNPQPVKDPFWNTDVEPQPLNPEPKVETKPLERTFARDQILIGNQNDPYFTIEQVKITKNSTLITFAIQSISNKVYAVKLDRKGGSNAFYLTDRAYQKIYKLKNIRSLNGWPSKAYPLRPGEKKYFTAEFDRLDDDVEFFHILEGKSNREEAWDFWDVELKN